MTMLYFLLPYGNKCSLIRLFYKISYIFMFRKIVRRCAFPRIRPLASNEPLRNVHAKLYDNCGNSCTEVGSRMKSSRQNPPDQNRPEKKKCQFLFSVTTLFLFEPLFARVRIEDSSRNRFALNGIQSDFFGRMFTGGILPGHP